MMNAVSLIGRLTKKPDIRTTGTGKSVTDFTVAVNRRFGDKDKADFIRCTAWNQTAEFITNYLDKGALVGLTGRIETGSYEDADGKIVYTTDVIVDNLQALESQKQREQNVPTDNRVGKPEINEQPINIHSDDLPF